MKKKLLLIISLLISSCGVSDKPIDVSKCDLISDNKSEMYKILYHGGIYEATTTKGMLCYGYEDDTIITNVPINKGVPDGNVKIFYPNYQIKEERNYKKGLLNGVQKKYYENGKLDSEVNYKNGKRYGIAKIYDESGKLKYEANFKNDRAEGIGKRYYESGALWSEANHKNGKQ